jgi:hypothetical protein
MVQMNKIANPFKLNASVGRSLPSESFILANPRSEGATIGHLADKPISETVIDGDGHRYRYVGVASRNSDGCFDVDSLRRGEWIVNPGLIYGRVGKLRADTDVGDEP